MKQLAQELGYMVQSQDGKSVWGAGSRRFDGWCLYKTRKGAEKAAKRCKGATVIAVTLTIEERETL